MAEINWCPGEKDRWFFERARGSYQVAQFNAGTTKSQKTKFKLECPPTKKFQKTDVAKIMHLWRHRPHDVSAGAQKNFNQFMVELNEFGDVDWKPNSDYFKKLIGIYILFKATEKIVRPNFQAYRANISAYTVSWISFHAKTEFDYELVWQKQDISEALKAQTKAQTDMAKLQIEAQQAIAKDDRERDQMDQDLLVDAAKILGQYGTSVDVAQIKADQAAPRYPQQAPVDSVTGGRF